jgi:hypothetical protein
MRVALCPHVRVFLLLGLHTSGVVVHLIDSGKDSFEHVIPGQDVLHRLGKLDIDTDALLVQTRVKVFYAKGHTLFYLESVKLFLNNPLVDKAFAVILGEKRDRPPNELLQRSPHYFP